MATEYLPNQPISFINDLDTCASPTSKYVQIIDASDITQFQFKVTPCATCTNKMDVETFGEGWGVTLDGLCKQGLGTADYEVTIGDVGLDGLTYVTLTVTSVSGTIKVGISGLDAGDVLGYITAPGTYTYYTPVQTGGGVLYLHPVTSDSTVCVDTTASFTVCDISTNYKILIKDLDGNVVDTVTNAHREISSNFITYYVNWSYYGITSGCYTLCVLDPCLDVNHDIDDHMSTIWTFSGDEASTLTTGPGNSVEFNSTNPEGNSYGNADNSVHYMTDGKCYNVTFTVTGLYGCNVYFYTPGFTSTIITSDGTYSFDFTQMGSGPWRFVFACYPSDYSYGVISNMSIYTCDSALVCNCCSVPVKIGTFDCTHLIKATNDKNGLGFNFTGSQFIPQIRLFSKLVRASYQTTRESFEDSAGAKNTTYFKRRRSKAFRVDPAVAEYVHDFLSTLGGYDHVYIDDREYFIDDDEYQVSYPSRNDVEAIVSINVSEKEQLIENKSCGDTNTNYENIIDPGKSCNC